METVCGYASILKDELTRTGLTIQQIMEGRPYEYQEGAMCVTFRKKGQKTTLEFGDEPPKKEYHKADYVWKSLL